MWSPGTPEWLKREYEFFPPLDGFQVEERTDFRNDKFWTIVTPGLEPDEIFEPVDVTPGFYSRDDLISWWREYGDRIKDEYFRTPDTENFQNFAFNLISEWDRANAVSDKTPTPKYVGNRQIEYIKSELLKYRQMLLSENSPIEKGKILASIEGLKKQLRDLRMAVR